MDKKRKSRRLLGKYDGKKLGWFRLMRELLLWLAVMAVVFQLVMGVAKVQGDSMYPTLKSGQIVVYSRLGRAYKKGDVLSLRMPSGEYYVKRVAAVGGDTVELKDGALYVNGVKETGSFAGSPTYPLDGVVTYPYKVEEGKFFVLGDNRAGSVDSRTFGAVVGAQIKGKLLFVK